MSDDTPEGVDVRDVLPQIARLSRALERGRLVEQAAAGSGLNLDRSAMGVLLATHLAGRPVRIGEIAERMQVAGPHVTRQVQELERRGLVRRIADPSDRRASLIEPTEDGAAATDRYTATMVGFFTDAISHWSAEDRADLGRLLKRFAADVVTRLND
jgi:DNA-binding MarR family transcriptional regulator